MDALRWQRLSPLLDGVLDLPEAARQAYLRKLQSSDPALAAQLCALLALERTCTDFLRDPPAGVRTEACAGSLIGPYRLERLIGMGGMGQVWLAVPIDGRHPQPVALKLLRPGPARRQLRDQLLREREILSRLRHPNIAALVDAGFSEDDHPWLALEHVDGIPLNDYCAHHALPVDARLRLFLQVCAAVSHAHANRVVHRDLKPSNMLVAADGQVRLLDFGIAATVDTIARGAGTRDKVRAFTLRYAAPEQLRGEPPAFLTDVYALGVVLYELLTTCRPYRLRRRQDGAAAWENAILNEAPVPPSHTVQGVDHLQPLEPQLRGDLDAILLMAMRKTATHRYGSVDALALDLQRHLDGQPVQAMTPPCGRPLRPPERHRWTEATLASTLLLASFVTTLWHAQGPAREAAAAQRITLAGAGAMPGRTSALLPTHVMARKAERVPTNVNATRSRVTPTSSECLR